MSRAYSHKLKNLNRGGRATIPVAEISKLKSYLATRP